VPLIRYPNFTGGNYTVQNRLASREYTVNFCPELLTAPGAANRLVLNPTPGVRLFATAPKSPHRGMYEHNGRCYFVSGDRFYELFVNGTFIDRGTVALDPFPVTIHANGEAGKQLFITSGGFGYIYNTATHAFDLVRHDDGSETLVDGEPEPGRGQPLAVTMGGMLDGFFMALDAKTSTFQVSRLLEGRCWDDRIGGSGGGGGQIRSAAPDPWRAMCVNDKMIALMGDKTTEFWYNAGASPFPFEPVPNALIPFGIHAPWSPVSIGGMLFWVARTTQDINQVVMVNGTQPDIISTPASHWMAVELGRTDDALGYGDAYLGHLSYGVTFPQAARTAVFDLSTRLWHEEGTWLTEQNRYDALRPHYRCFAFGRQLIGDRSSGRIYQRHPLFTNDVDERPIRRVRRAPLLFGDGRVLAFGSFELICQLGQPLHEPMKPIINPLLEIDPSTPSELPQVELRRSNDGGETWWSAGFRSSGKQGEFMYRPTWNRLGATDQFAGFEVVMASPIPWRIVDALVDIQPGTR
jgi:hypothetical protein